MCTVSCCQSDNDSMTSSIDYNVAVHYTTLLNTALYSYIVSVITDVVTAVFKWKWHPKLSVLGGALKITNN